jgi:hypothetical protein
MLNGKGSNRKPDIEDGLPDVLEWSVHPSARHPVKSALAVMAVGMIGGGVYQATGAMEYCFLAVVILLVTLAPFFFKTVYRLDKMGVTAMRFGRMRRLGWRQVRSMTMSKASIYLSRYSSKSIRERYGILLLNPADLEQVYRYIQKYRNDELSD